MIPFQTWSHNPKLSSSSLIYATQSKCWTPGCSYGNLAFFVPLLTALHQFGPYLFHAMASGWVHQTKTSSKLHANPFRSCCYRPSCQVRQPSVWSSAWKQRGSCRRDDLGLGWGWLFIKICFPAIHQNLSVKLLGFSWHHIWRQHSNCLLYKVYGIFLQPLNL